MTLEFNFTSLTQLEGVFYIPHSGPAVQKLGALVSDLKTENFVDSLTFEVPETPEVSEKPETPVVPKEPEIPEVLEGLKYQSCLKQEFKSCNDS